MTYHENGVDVNVVDTGRPVRRRLPGGHGLEGLRERVTRLGGRLEAGTAATGEYVTSVALPIVVRT
jgi:signal transduction histidine kinase